jgi:hypothetical protein
MVLERIHTTAGFQRNEIAALRGLEERGVNVGAVRYSVRLPELLHERITKRDIGNQLARQSVAHFLGGGTMGIGKDRVLQPNLLQNPKNIRPKLDASPDFAEFRRLLEDPYWKALVGERIGRDEPADASAGNEKGGGAAIRTSHGDNLTSLGPIDWQDHKT